MKKLGLILILAIPLSAMARPDLDNQTICYGINSKGQQTYKTSCIVTSTGGAGQSLTIFTIKGKEYTIAEGYENSLNGLPYKTYARDAFFKKTTDDDAPYYCHQSKKVHFCFKAFN